jgi:hypothetical protein
VVVAERPKSASNHAILEVAGAIEGSDSAGVLDSEPKMAPLPCDLLMHADKSGDRTAMARAPVQSVDAMCKSMLRERSKHRSIGAAMSVTNWMRTIISSAVT